MSSAWQCSRNNTLEGFAVIAAAVAAGAFQTGSPDLAIALGLVVLFARSGTSVLREARG